MKARRGRALQKMKTASVANRLTSEVRKPVVVGEPTVMPAGLAEARYMRQNDDVASLGSASDKTLNDGHVGSRAVYDGGLTSIHPRARIYPHIGLT